MKKPIPSQLTITVRDDNTVTVFNPKTGITSHFTVAELKANGTPEMKAAMAHLHPVRVGS